MNIKPVLIITLFVFIPTCILVAQKTEDGLKKNRIRYEQEYFVVMKEEKAIDSVLLSTTEYDSSGLKVKKSTYDESGSIKWMDSFYYNGLNHIIMAKEWNLKLNTLKIREYEYDVNANQISERIKFASNNKTSKEQYKMEYDKDGKLLKKYYKNEYYSSYLYQKYEYDVNGLLVKAASYEPNGDWGYSILYEYDSSKNLIAKFQENDSEKKLIESYSYKNGILIGVKVDKSTSSNLGNGSYITTKIESQTVYEYNDLGLLSYVVGYRNNKIISCIHYIYKM